MKKIEITKNEMASILGGASHRTVGSVNGCPAKDKLDRHGKIKRIKITCGLAAANQNGDQDESDWISHDWGILDSEATNTFLADPSVQFLGFEPDDQF